MTNRKNQVLQHLILIIVTIFMAYPFYFLIVSITNTSNDVISGKMTFGSNLLINLTNTFANPLIMKSFMNSLIVAIVITILSIIVSFTAAYAFQFYGNKKTEYIYNLFLLSMMIPFAAVMIPLFKLVVSLGMANSYLAIIIPGICSVFNIFFVRQSLKKFPIDVIESARIDGANELKIFVKIVSPMMVPTYATIAIMTFMGAWTNYLWPLIVISAEDKYMLPQVLANLSSASNLYPDYGVIMVVTLLSAIPLVILFFSLQKYFVNGLGGSVK